MFPPYGVKILWFVLSLIGLLGCWVVSLALGRTIGSQWALVLYSVGCTVLHGIFCVGMAWRMDPLSMPPAFCTLQAVFVALGTFLITGVMATFSYMTYLIIKKPKTWGEQKHYALKWQHLFLLPTAVFPAVATSIYIACVLKLNSVHPTRDFFCDSSMPQWVRFMSYAGMPLLPSIPSLYLSIQSLRQVQETTKHIQRARTGEVDFGSPSSSAFTSPPPHKRVHDLDSASIRASNSSPDPSLRFAISPPGRRSEGRRPIVKFRIPIKPPSSDSERDTDIDIALSRMASTSSFPASQSALSQEGSTETKTTEAAEEPITSPPRPKGLEEYSSSQEKDSEESSRHPEGLEEYSASQEKDEDWKGSLDVSRTVATVAVKGGKGWHNDGAESEIQWAMEDTKVDVDKEEDDNMSEEIRIGMPRIRTHSKRFDGAASLFRSKRPPPCYLSPAIRRIIIFQITFVIVQIIGSLSTLVDVAIGRPSPTPLGTHHFAMLFVVWGPVFAFASLDSVRRHLIPPWIRTVYQSITQYNRNTCTTT